LDLRLADELKKSWQIVHHEAATFPALRLCGAKNLQTQGVVVVFFLGGKKKRHHWSKGVTRRTISRIDMKEQLADFCHPRFLFG
jgi:hypothetical protein